MGLTSGVKITFHTTATTIGGKTIGNMKAVRTVARKREVPLSNNAMPSPIASCNATVSPTKWRRAALLNISGMSWFSSDRAIAEYAKDIWDIAT
jgi:glucan phosphorylase